ncbi:MAG: Wzz/FepE/Etk N-terminal domain-containing protein [Bacteroidales bacterium]|nr:Wzz/FepE/Etk N-terminal domain-containing protein [Bacteroidales bacterium]
MAENIHLKKSNEISFKEIINQGKEIWQFLWSKWVIILIVGLLGGAIGFTLSFIVKPKYTAKLTFAVANDKSNPLGAYSGLASMAGIDLGGGGSDLFSSDNIMDLMKSKRMIENTLLSPIEVDGKNMTLIERYFTFKKLRKKWKKKSYLSNISYEIKCDPAQFTRLQDSIIGTVCDDLSKTAISVGKPDKKLSIIESKITTTDEIFSKEFLQGLILNVSDFYIETKTKRLTQNVDILQSRADSLSDILTSSTLNIATLTDQNLNAAKAVVNAGKARKQIDLQVTGAVYTEVVKQLELSKVTLQKETPLIQVVDSPVYPLEKKILRKSIGIAVGGLLGGFLILAWLLGKRYYQQLMKEESV